MFRHALTGAHAQAGAPPRWQHVPLPLTSAVAVQELLARLAPVPGQAPGRAPDQAPSHAPDQAPGRAPNQARAPRPRRPAWRDATDEQVAALFAI